MDATEWVLSLNEYAMDCLDVNDDEVVDRLTMTVMAVGSQLGLEIVVNEQVIGRET